MTAPRHDASASLDVLFAEVRRCSHCAAHLPLGPRPVLQVGRESRILIAGQAPGRRVHHTGVPFDDPSGDRLRTWLGVTREQFYDATKFAILPMGFCFPGTGRSGDNPPRPECAPLWRDRLLAQLPNVRLTLLVGRYAQAWHLGDRFASLTAAVEEWRDHWPGLLPLPHPSPRNQAWLKRHPWFEAEVLPVLRERVRELTAG